MPWVHVCPACVAHSHTGGRGSLAHGWILQPQHMESHCPGGAVGTVTAPRVREWGSAQDTAMGDQSSTGHGSCQT